MDPLTVPGFTGSMSTSTASPAPPTADPAATTVILGGAGKTGRRVEERLRALGSTVRTASRRTSTPFDWSDPATHRPALAGATSAYLSYYPDIAFPGAAEHLEAVAEAAVDVGVERLVLLSGRGEPEAVPAEDAVRRSGVAWTVLRCSWFMQNFSEHFLLGPVLEGVIALPAGDVVEPFVDLDDVAEVAVAALTDAGHDGRTHELTGPELLSFDSVAATLSRVTGRTVRYDAVTASEYGAAARAAGVPEEEIGPLTELFTRVLEGHNAVLTDDLGLLLGRAPTTFARYAERAAATGVWTVAP